MSKTAFIFARGGSKGLPGKNIKMIAGKPLIAWSIEQALEVDEIERVIVSTDSREIAAISQDFGALVPFIRPPELATDEAPEWLSWKHALNFLLHSEKEMPSELISIPPTSPLRGGNDIRACLDLYRTGKFDTVLAVSEARRNPFFNMLQLHEDGCGRIVIKQDERPARRQDATAVYDISTVCYVINSSFIMKNTSIFDGRIGMHEVSPQNAIDIDSELEFRIAEFLLKERLSSGS